MTQLTLVLLLFRARHGLALKRADSLQHRQLARSVVTIQDLLGTFGSTRASSATRRYARHRPRWKLATRIPGLPHLWLQVKPVASTYWSIGCRVCRWYNRRSAILGTSGHCNTNPSVHMEVRGCSLQISTLRGHADVKQHVGRRGSAEG